MVSRSKRSVEIGDMTGKVVFVTGASRGIGLETAKQLYLHGATVYIGARTEEKGRAAIASVEKDIAALPQKDKAGLPARGKMVYHECDISTPALAKGCAERFAEREGKLDVLVNNAALLADKAVIKQIMTVNHFATFALVEALLPLLVKTAQTESDVRIVTVASMAAKMGRAKDPNLRFRTWEDYNVDYSKDMLPALSTYGISKLTAIMALKGLQRRLSTMPSPGAKNITCIAVHPGMVNTFDDKLPANFKWLLNPLLGIVYLSPSDGALTTLFAAASPEVVREREKYKGVYMVPFGKIESAGTVAESEERQDELWESTEKILREWPGEN